MLCIVESFLKVRNHFKKLWSICPIFQLIIALADAHQQRQVVTTICDNKIATSVELIAQRVSNIEGKVDDTNRKVDAQAKAWQETERKLSEKVNETENKPYKQIANNVNTVKVAIITCISTLLVSGVIGAIIAFGK